MEWTLEQAEEMRTGRPIYGEKDKGGALTWLRTGKETDGEYGLLYVELAPGHWIPAHYHTAYTETFKVCEGYLPGLYGKQKITVEPGQSVAISPGTVHGWGPLAEGEVKAIVEIRPAHEGFEKWLMIAHNMAVDGQHKPKMQMNSFAHTALILVETDTRLGGKARMLNPIVTTVAWLARKAGMDRKLEEKYYRPIALSS